jgi:hypothetical protein
MERTPLLTLLKAARLYAQDYTEEQIASILGIAPSTVNGAIDWAIRQNRLKEQQPYVFISKGLKPESSAEYGGHRSSGRY